MKIIEALKKTQELQRKASDLRIKIAKHSAHLNYETPMYKNQKQQVSEWLQAHSDILKEILRLRVDIQRTNLATDVDIELGGKVVTKTIAEWIHRRRDLADTDLTAWQVLSDRGLKEGKTKNSAHEEVEVKIVRCYDPAERDRMMDLYSSEATTIDAKLEIMNAVTNLIEEDNLESDII
jgi:hypothetical protein